MDSASADVRVEDEIQTSPQHNSFKESATRHFINETVKTSTDTNRVRRQVKSFLKKISRFKLIYKQFSSLKFRRHGKTSSMSGDGVLNSWTRNDKQALLAQMTVWFPSLFPRPTSTRLQEVIVCLKASAHSTGSRGEVLGLNPQLSEAKYQRKLFRKERLNQLLPTNKSACFVSTVVPQSQKRTKISTKKVSHNKTRIETSRKVLISTRDSSNSFDSRSAPYSNVENKQNLINDLILPTQTQFNQDASSIELNQSLVQISSANKVSETEKCHIPDWFRSLLKQKLVVDLSPSYPNINHQTEGEIAELVETHRRLVVSKCFQNADSPADGQLVVLVREQEEVRHGEMISATRSEEGGRRLSSERQRIDVVDDAAIVYKRDMDGFSNLQESYRQGSSEISQKTQSVCLRADRTLGDNSASNKSEMETGDANCSSATFEPSPELPAGYQKRDSAPHVSSSLICETQPIVSDGTMLGHHYNFPQCRSCMCHRPLTQYSQQPVSWCQAYKCSIEPPCKRSVDQPPTPLNLLSLHQMPVQANPTPLGYDQLQQTCGKESGLKQQQQQPRGPEEGPVSEIRWGGRLPEENLRCNNGFVRERLFGHPLSFGTQASSPKVAGDSQTVLQLSSSFEVSRLGSNVRYSLTDARYSRSDVRCSISEEESRHRKCCLAFRPLPDLQPRPTYSCRLRSILAPKPGFIAHNSEHDYISSEQSVSYLPGSNVDVYLLRNTFDEKPLCDPQYNFCGVCLPGENGPEQILDQERHQKSAAKSPTGGGVFKGDQNCFRRGMFHNSCKSQSMKVNISKGGDTINRIRMKSRCDWNNKSKQTLDSQSPRYVRSDVNDLVGGMETKFHRINKSNSSVYGDDSNIEFDKNVVMDTFVKSCPVSKTSSNVRSQNKEINDLEVKLVSSKTKITSSTDLVSSLQTFCAANSQKYSACNYRNPKFLVRKSNSVTTGTVLSRLKNKNTERGALLPSLSDSGAVHRADDIKGNTIWKIINENAASINNEVDMHLKTRIKKYFVCGSAMRKLKQRSDVADYVKEQWQKRSSLTNLEVDAGNRELSLTNKRAGESDDSDSRLSTDRAEIKAFTENSDALDDYECSCFPGEKQLTERVREQGGSGDNEVRKEFSYERMCAERRTNYDKLCQAIDKYNRSTYQEDDQRFSCGVSLLIQKSKELRERLLTESSRKEVSTTSKIDCSDGDYSSKPEEHATDVKSLLKLSDLKTKDQFSITNKTSVLSLNDKQGGEARSDPVKPTLGKNDSSNMILFGINKKQPQFAQLIHSNVPMQGSKQGELRYSEVNPVSVSLQDSSDNTANTTLAYRQAHRKVSAHSLSVLLSMMQDEISLISKNPDPSDETIKCPLGRFHSLLQTFDKFVSKFLQLNRCCCLSKHYKIREAETGDCLTGLDNQTCYMQTYRRPFRMNNKKLISPASRHSPKSKHFHPFRDNCLSLFRENQTQNIMTEPAQDRSVNNGRESPPVRINSKDPSVSETEADDTISVNSFEHSQKGNEQGGQVRREPGNMATTTQSTIENLKAGTSKPITTSSKSYQRHPKFDTSNPPTGTAFNSTIHVSKQLTLKSTDMESIEKRSERTQINNLSVPNPELPNRLSVSTRLLGQGHQESESKTPYLRSGVGTETITDGFQGKSNDHYFPSNDQSNANPKALEHEMHKNVSWQTERGNPKLDTFVSSERRPVSIREQPTAPGQQTTSPRPQLPLWKQSSLVSERRPFISENTRDEFSREFANSPTRTGTCGYCGSHFNSERHSRPYMTHDARYFPDAPNDTGQPHKYNLDRSEFQRAPPDQSPVAGQRSNRDYMGAAFSNTQPDLPTGVRNTLPTRDAVTNLFVNQTAVFAPKCSASTSPIKTISRLIDTDKSARTATKSPAVPAPPLRTSIRDICNTILTANKASGSPVPRQDQIHAGMRSESPRRRNLIQIPTGEFAVKRALRMDTASPRKPPCPKHCGTLEADNRLLDPSKSYRDPSLLEEACARELDRDGQSAFQQYICSKLREIQAGRTGDSETCIDDLIVFKCPSQRAEHKHPAQIKTCAPARYTQESQSPRLVTPRCKNDRIIDRNHVCIQTCACLCRPDGICVCGFLPTNPLGKLDRVCGSRSSSGSLRCRGTCKHACIKTCDSEQDSDRIFGVDEEEELWATPVVATPACPYRCNKRNKKCQVGHQKVSRDIQTNTGTSLSRAVSPYHRACSPFHLVGGTTPSVDFVATSQEPLCCKCRQIADCAPGKVQENQKATDSVGNLLRKNCHVFNNCATAPIYGRCKAGKSVASSGAQSRCGCRQDQQRNLMTGSNMCSQSEQESSLILAQFSQDCTDENWALPKKKKPVIHIRYKPKSSTFSPAVVGGQCPSDCLSQQLREEIFKIVQNSKLLQQQVQQLKNKCKYFDSQQWPSTNQNRHDSATTDRRRCRSDRLLQCQQKQAGQGTRLNKNDNANSPDVLQQGTTNTHTSPNIGKPVRCTRTRMTKMLQGRLDRVCAVEAQSSSQLGTPLVKFENKDGAVVLSSKPHDKASELQFTAGKIHNERTMSSKNMLTRDVQTNLSQTHCMCYYKNCLQDITSNVVSLEPGNRRKNQYEGQVPTYTSPQNEKYYINDPSEEAYQYISLNFPEIRREPYVRDDIGLNLNLSKDSSIKARDSSVTISCHQKGAPLNVSSDRTQRKSATSDKVTQTTNSDTTVYRNVISPSEMSRGVGLSNLSCKVGKMVDSCWNQQLTDPRDSQPELAPEKQQGNPRIFKPASDYWTLAYRVGSLGTAFTPKISYKEQTHKSSADIFRRGLGPRGDNLQLFRRFPGDFERCSGRSSPSAGCIAASSTNSVGTRMDRSRAPGCVPTVAQEASSCSTICTDELRGLVRNGQLKVNRNQPKNAQQVADLGHCDHSKTMKRISVLDQVASRGSVTSVSTDASRISIDVNLNTASLSTGNDRKRDMAYLHHIAQHIQSGIGISQHKQLKSTWLKLPNQRGGQKTAEPADIRDVLELSVSEKDIEGSPADVSSQSTLNLESDFCDSTVSTINLDTQHSAPSLTIVNVSPGFQSAENAEACIPKNTIPMTPPHGHNAADSQDSIHGVDDLPLDSVSELDSKNTGFVGSSYSEDKDQFLEEQSCLDMYERMLSVNKRPVLSGCYCDSKTTTELRESFDCQRPSLPFSPNIVLVDAAIKTPKRVPNIFNKQLKQFEVTDGYHMNTKSLKPRPLPKSPFTNTKNVVAWSNSSDFRKERFILKNASERARTNTPGATSGNEETSQYVGTFANRRKFPTCKRQVPEPHSQKSDEVDNGSIKMMEEFKVGSSLNLPVDCVSCHVTEHKQLPLSSKKKESSIQWRTTLVCCAEVAVVSHDQVIIQGVYYRSLPSKTPRKTKIMQESFISPHEPDKHSVGLPFKLVLSREDKASGDYQDLGGFYSRRLLTRDDFFEWKVLRSSVL